mgnify:CR=1 FL=1
MQEVELGWPPSVLGAGGLSAFDRFFFLQPPYIEGHESVAPVAWAPRRLQIGCTRRVSDPRPRRALSYLRNVQRIYVLSANDVGRGTQLDPAAPLQIHRRAQARRGAVKNPPAYALSAVAATTTPGTRAWPT